MEYIDFKIKDIKNREFQNRRQLISAILENPKDFLIEKQTININDLFSGKYFLQFKSFVVALWIDRGNIFNHLTLV